MENRKYKTGAQRDSDKGKPKLTYLPWDVLDRPALHLEIGANKYGNNNFRLGMTSSEIEQSMQRHMRCYWMGMQDEDHLSGVVANALFLMVNEKYYADDPEIHDLPKVWAERNVMLNRGKTDED